MPPDMIDAELIELFYKSAVNPALWQAALSRLVEKFNGDHAMLFTNKDASPSLPFFESSGLSTTEVAGYTSSPLAIAAWEQFQSVMTPGRAVSQQAIVSDRDFERSEVYNEVVRPTNGFHASFVQQDVPGLSFHLAVCRPRSRGPFADDEVAALQRWVPHLTGAMRLHQKLHAIERRADVLSGAIERLDHGVIVCGRNGSPTLINRRAARVLDVGDGLALVGNTLRADHQTQTARLLTAIREAVSATQTMQLPRKPPALPLLLEIMPVGHLSSTEDLRRADVAIFITEPDGAPKLNREAIADVYRLTPREAEIALLLAMGLSIETIAVKLALAIGTVRFNLKRVFEKTGARSQPTLVALMRGFARRAR